MIILAETPDLERWCAENIDSGEAGDKLLEIINGIVAAEREACAKVVEAFKADMPEHIDMAGYRTKIAARIRARD